MSLRDRACTAWDGARRAHARSLSWAARILPPGLRLIVGLILIAAGALGFLPVLGFWMIPLGIGIAALDIAWLWRWMTGRGKR